MLSLDLGKGLMLDSSTTLNDVLIIMNESFAQLSKEMNELRTLVLSTHEVIGIMHDIISNSDWYYA